MESPTDLPASEQGIRIQPVPAPIWVRFLAASADCIVAGLFSFAFILVVLIPRFYPETQAIIYEYVEQSGGSMITDNDLAETLRENESLRNMLFASQMILYSVFFLYYLFNESMLKGSSLGKKIFRIRTIRRTQDEPLSLSTVFFRAWLKTVFLLLLFPLLWITFIWAFFEKDRRTVHDLLTGTWVTD